ncbi:MAG: NAD(P)/FAD-dependent oxidoreductase [Sporichthyaceae bacterium]
MPDVDLLVAGAGPVGLAAALHARAAGLTVAVVEPRTDPVDKACGEGLMPAALAELRGLGVEPVGRPFVGIRYLAPGRAVSATFRDGPGLGVRRTALHAVLVAQADVAGVTRVRGRVGPVEQDAFGVSAGGLRASWLLAADGLHSPLRRAIGLERAAPGGRRYGLRRHYAVRPWSDRVEVHWAEHTEAYVTPVADGLVGVALLGGDRGRLPYDEALACFPRLLARLRGAEAVTDVRGAGPLRQVAASPRAGRVLLVGDAAGYVDALTGEGLAVGLATARVAVGAVATGRPETYPAAWRAATRRYRWSAGVLLVVAGRPLLRRGLVPAAAALPAVFGLAVDHVA